MAGTCGAGATSKLKVKADDGALEVEFEVEHARRGSALARHARPGGTRRLARQRPRAGRGSGRFAVERRLRDLAGADRIGVRASGPGGVSCRAAATLPGA